MNSKQTSSSKSVDPRFAKDAVAGFAKNNRSSPVSSRGVNQLARNCVDLFETILSEVSGTPREAAFVAVLRHLSKIVSTRCLQGQRIWNVVEHLVHRTVLLQDSRSLSRVGQSGLRCIAHFAARINTGAPMTVAAGASYSAADGKSPATTTTKDGKGSRVDKHSVGASQHQMRSKTPDQQNPDGHSHGCSLSNHPPAPPPLPPPLSNGGVGGTLRAPSRTESESSPSAPGGSPSQTRLGSPGGESGAGGGGGGAAAIQWLFPQQKIPQPRTPMKRFQWTKIPVARVASCPGNVWSEVALSFGGYRIDFDRMEELFSSSPGGGGGSSAGCSGIGGWSTGGRARESSVDGSSSGHCEKKTKRTDEINLIDSKRSMNVNIFLRQFRTTNFDIVGCLRAGEGSKMGPERLRSLLKILPETEEVQLLQSFDGDRALLGSAEKFYLELMALPDHRLVAEALLMKEEFPPTIDYIKPAIDAIVLSARDIKDCKALHEIMYAIVMAGNFLNSGVYSGNAAGFQLQSLLKLSDLRSNKPQLSLLHFVAQETEEKNPHLMEQLKELKYLSEASQYSIELLLSEISTLQGRVRTISSQLTNCGWKFQEQMKRFLEMASAEMEVLEFDTKELEELRLELAAYFCEDVLTFKLDDCISTFNSFCKMFLKALEENKERHLQDMRAEERRRLREEKIASKRRLLTATESGKTAVTLGSVGQTNNEVRHQNTKSGDRLRIASLSQTLPTFLQETGRPTKQTDEELSTMHQRRTKRNSESNLPTTDWGPRRTWPPSASPAATDSAADDDDDPAEQNELLLNALLKAAAAASAVDETDRRPGSVQRQRRRSRASVEALYEHRERASSPADIGDVAPGKDRPRSPSLPPPPSCFGVTAAGPPAADEDDSESPGVSNAAETNAKREEREHRRMERRRRSQRAAGSAVAPCRSTEAAAAATSVSSALCSHRQEADRVPVGHPPPPPQTPQGLFESRDQKETETENHKVVARRSLVTAPKRTTSGDKIIDRRNVCGRKRATEKTSASKSDPQNNSPLGSTVKTAPNDNSHKPRPSSSSAASKTRGVAVSRADQLWQKGCDDDKKMPKKIRSNKHSDKSVPRGNKRTQEESKAGVSVQTDGTPSNVNAGEIVADDEVSAANVESFPPGHSSDPDSKDAQKTAGDEEGAETPSGSEKKSARPSCMDENDGSCECDGRLTAEAVVDRGNEEETEIPTSGRTALDSVAVSLYDTTATTEPPPPPPDGHRPPPSSSSKFSCCGDAASNSSAVYRDEGIDMEAASLSSASQRTSLCSTVELNVRVTPPMTRKDYDGGGGGREGRPGRGTSSAVPSAARTPSSSIEKTVASKRCSSSSWRRNGGSPRDSNKQATPKNQMTSSAAAAAAKISRASRHIASASGKTTTTAAAVAARSFLAKTLPHKSPGIESNIKIQQKTTTTTSKTRPATAAAAVRYKIAKPNFVSYNGDDRGKSKSNSAAAGARASPSAASTPSGRNAKILVLPKSKAVSSSVKGPRASVSVATGGSTSRPAAAAAAAAKSAISAQKKKTVSSSDEKRRSPICQNSQQQQQQLATKLSSLPAIAGVPPPGEIVATPGNFLGTLTGDRQQRRGAETATPRSTKRETATDTRRVLSHSAVGSWSSVSFASVLGSKRSFRSESHTTP